MAQQHKYDVAIVGGGISGLYTAWRLAKNTDYSVAVLEYSDRFGGRYRTCKMPGGFSAELGAMRYEADLHPILHNLIQEMKLKTEPFYTPTEDIKRAYYIRGELLWTEEEVHQRFNIHKEDKKYMGLGVVTEMELPENGNFFRATLKGSSQLARNVTMRQFWSEASTSGVHEWESVGLVSRHTLASLGGIWSPYHESKTGKSCNWDQSMMCISTGAESLITELLAQVTKLNVKLFSGHAVTRIEEHSKLGFRVKATVGALSMPAWFSAEKLILACNARGVEMITWISESDRTTQIQKLLGCVEGLSVTKAALTYTKPWWEQKGMVSGSLLSDVLNQRMLFMGDRAKRGGFATLLVHSFNHSEIMEGLNSENEKFENQEGDIPEDLVPSRVAVETIQKELRAAFDGVNVLEPVSACLTTWSKDPIAHCWYTPKVGVNHNRIYWESLRPFEDDSEVFMIGDTFAAVTRDCVHAAWTEGPLLTAERVLYKYFGMMPTVDNLCLENPWPED